mmetsp:Transcript_63289/g.184976  ORF Transcript_63289/g.184976 Transcript_63289/m.184976 type:complete len:262 (-) Transcript_63289:2197-2982(-)
MRLPISRRERGQAPDPVRVPVQDGDGLSVALRAPDAQRVVGAPRRQPPGAVGEAVGRKSADVVGVALEGAQRGQPPLQIRPDSKRVVSTARGEVQLAARRPVGAQCHDPLRVSSQHGNSPCTEGFQHWLEHQEVSQVLVPPAAASDVLQHPRKLSVQGQFISPRTITTRGDCLLGSIPDLLGNMNLWQLPHSFHGDEESTSHEPQGASQRWKTMRCLLLLLRLVLLWEEVALGTDVASIEEKLMSLQLQIFWNAISCRPNM